MRDGLIALAAKATAASPKAADMQDASVPQKWFLHFYIIGAAWNAIILAADMTACSRGTLQLDVQQVQPAF